jgi:hypothetical protein
MHIDCLLLNSLDQNIQGQKEDVNVIEGMGYSTFLWSGLDWADREPSRERTVLLESKLKQSEPN